jgi:hypothetical protein
LILALKGPQVDYCPRCIAKRRQPVPLIAEALTRRHRHTEPASDAECGVESLRPRDAPGSGRAGA